MIPKIHWFGPKSTHSFFSVDSLIYNKGTRPFKFIRTKYVISRRGKEQNGAKFTIRDHFYSLTGSIKNIWEFWPLRAIFGWKMAIGRFKAPVLKVTWSVIGLNSSEIARYRPVIGWMKIHPHAVTFNMATLNPPFPFSH